MDGVSHSLQFLPMHLCHADEAGIVVSSNSGLSQHSALVGLAFSGLSYDLVTGHNTYIGQKEKLNKHHQQKTLLCQSIFILVN